MPNEYWLIKELGEEMRVVATNPLGVHDHVEQQIHVVDYLSYAKLVKKVEMLTEYLSLIEQLAKRNSND